MMCWLLLIYKVPNEPSARWVYVWRKLKGMGAILLQDAAWVLPTNLRTREKMQWFTTEIKGMEGGNATLWQAEVVFTGQDTDLMQQFMVQVDTVYSQILSHLEREDADLPTQSKQCQQTKLQDYFDSEIGNHVRETLISRRGGEVGNG